MNGNVMQTDVDSGVESTFSLELKTKYILYQLKVFHGHKFVLL